jgi:hypothetical protein
MLFEVSGERIPPPAVPRMLEQHSPPAQSEAFFNQVHPDGIRRLSRPFLGVWSPPHHRLRPSSL